MRTIRIILVMAAFAFLSCEEGDISATFELDLVTNIYPNPCGNEVSVELNEESEIAYQLVDLNGKTLLQGDFNGKLNKLDVSGLQNGHYQLILKARSVQYLKSIRLTKSSH